MSSFDTTDITSEDGAIVISIETLQAHRQQRDKEKCHHARVSIAPLEADLLCRDCGTRLDPIAWIGWAASEWREVQRMYKAEKAESARLDFRRWIVCQKCGERNFVQGRSGDEKERQKQREARLEKALEHISVLVPEAAAKYAPKIAQEALAAVMDASK